ncbi:MAG: nitrogen fixation protein [Oscillatoriales cyanobacterium CG2_30_44_21]|nr:MAG: nitrogen fixation protein [Oscillatoriales cyanobacterium CG2_30_44_21]
MKIAVSSQNQTNVTGHLGHCQKFWIYDVDSMTIQNKQLLQLTKAQSFHESSPKESHPLDEVQVLISGGMGNGLSRRIESKGIKPIVTPETDPDAAVNAYLAGSLIVKTQEERDRDHAAEHGEEHGAEAEHDGKCGCESN